MRQSIAKNLLIGLLVFASAASIMNESQADAATLARRENHSSQGDSLAQATRGHLRKRDDSDVPVDDSNDDSNDDSIDDSNDDVNDDVADGGNHSFSKPRLGNIMK